MEPVWETATQEIAHATKISFIGLWVNPILAPGLKRLLAFNKRRLRLVVVNPDAKTPNARTASSLAPANPDHRILKVLRNVLAKESSHDAKHLDFELTDSSPNPGQMPLMPSSEDFIAHEMDSMAPDPQPL